jgi:hypothetical protein
MGEDDSKVNIVQLFNSSSRSGVDRETMLSSAKQDETCQFIADMLETLMEMAAKENRSTLVYLLAIARIEAIEAAQKRG